MLALIFFFFLYLFFFFLFSLFQKSLKTTLKDVCSLRALFSKCWDLNGIEQLTQGG